MKWKIPAMGFIKMKNGATINLEASWALNILEVPRGVHNSLRNSGRSGDPFRYELRGKMS